MNWLFGIGLAVELGGGALLAWPILVRPKWKVGMIFPQSGPTVEGVQEIAYVEAGILVLILGFFLQLVGYVSESSSWWLYSLVVVTAFLVAFVGGGLFAGRVLLPIDLALARRQYKQTEAYRQEQEAERRLSERESD